MYQKLLTHEKNQGKGEAVKTALRVCKGEYIIFHDADLEYDSNDIIDFINLINSTKPDLIIGSRKIIKNLLDLIIFITILEIDLFLFI